MATLAACRNAEAFRDELDQLRARSFFGDCANWIGPRAEKVELVGQHLVNFSSTITWSAADERLRAAANTTRLNNLALARAHPAWFRNAVRRMWRWAHRLPNGKTCRPSQ